VGVKRYEMDVKYHGILLGKKGVTVKALEKASGATIRFETTPKGALVIMGTEKQRNVAWKLITSVQSTLPQILSQIRDKEIRSRCPCYHPQPRQIHLLCVHLVGMRHTAPSWHYLRFAP